MSKHTSLIQHEVLEVTTPHTLIGFNSSNKGTTCKVSTDI